ncbi:survival protein sure-like phosphatase/nucleotidase [Fusarium oxysporum f. sp. albedinis]|nr:survival protein sure-like phosphatase/nucleotidase [Fusarium oxysporum f. sp. albedinis]
MHILVVNDDGPPSSRSPYVQHLISELQAAGHIVSVVLPNHQRYWIGKSYLINEITLCTLSVNAGQDEWVLVSGTPAACVHIGLYHYFLDRGPVDLIISGPNFGQNASTLFALSSGTIGAALEATLCRKRAVALSFDQPGSSNSTAVAATVQHGVRIVEALLKQWPEDDGALFYSVNMPVVEDVSQRKIIWTGISHNFWGAESAFTEWAPNLDRLEEGAPGKHGGQDVSALESGYVRYV